MVDDKKRLELIEQLGTICEELGWIIAIPSVEENLPELIVAGEEDIVLEVVHRAFGDNVDLYTKEVIDEEMTEFIPAVTPKKGNTFH